MANKIDTSVAYLARGHWSYEASNIEKYKTYKSADYQMEEVKDVESATLDLWFIFTDSSMPKETSKLSWEEKMNLPSYIGSNNPEVKKDLLNRRAVAQFFEVMPIVLKNLHIETNIVMPIMRNEFNDPLPDYGLSDYAISFTVGERLLDRFTSTNIELFEVQTHVAYKNHIVDIWHNKLYHSWFADVKLDYKTEEEWGEILVYLLDCWMPAIKKH